MSSSRIQLVEEIFQSAADLPAEQRLAFLDQQCGSDAELRLEVESLLAHYAAADGHFLQRPAAALEHLGDGETEPPRFFGKYEVIRRIGEGGMSVVYEARQQNPARTVALKVIRPGLASPQMVRRFQREGELLARLQHPGIAHIYEAGMAGLDDGKSEIRSQKSTEVDSDLRLLSSDPAHSAPSERRAARVLQPYFAMELIRGEPLNEFAERHALDTSERLELMARVCDAVQHAHQHGVIHRDLKPANILVVSEGTEGRRTEDSGLSEQKVGARPSSVLSPGHSVLNSAQPKVLDFGVARASDADCRAVTLRTDVGQLIGTIPYMSPEQVAGDPDLVDTRSDVYALGVMLYELLAGFLPHDTVGCPIPEAVRRIREDEPARLGSVNRRFRGDIETIVARALDKVPERRYQSAAALAGDIRQFLSGAPIEARRDSALYVLKKNLRRHRGPVSAAVLVLILLVAFGIVSFVQAGRNLQLAHSERDARKAALIERDRADAEAQASRRALYYSRIGFAQAAMAAEDAGRVFQLLQACPADLRNWEWRYLRRLADRSTDSVVWSNGPLTTAVMSSDGRRLMTWRVDGKLGLFDVQSGEQLADADLDEPCAGIALNDDGSRFATARPDGEIFVRELPAGEALLSMNAPGPDGTPRPVRPLAYSDDGGLLASGHFDGSVSVWDAETGALVRTMEGHHGVITALKFVRDGRRLLSGGADGVVRLWDIETGTGLALAGHEAPIHSLAATLDGRWVASGSNDATVRLWDAANGQQIAKLEGHQFSVPSVGFNPDGTLLVSAGFEHTIKLWEVGTQRLLRSLRGHTDRVEFVSFTPDGNDIVSAGRNAVLKWWSVAAPEDVGRIVPWPRFQTYCAAFSPDSDLLAVGLADGMVRVWDSGTLDEVLTLEGHSGAVRGAVYTPDAAHIVSGSEDGKVLLWDLRSRRPIRTLAAHEAAVHWISLSPDGARVASGDHAGWLRIAELGGGEPVAVRVRQGLVSAGAFSPDGQHIATAGDDGSVQIRDARNAASILTWMGHKGIIFSLAYQPDGSEIATVGGDGRLNRWDAQTGEKLFGAAAHRGTALGVSFSPDGSRLVTSGDDHTIRIWDAETGEEILTLRGHNRLVYRAVFSPDGARMASTSDDGAVLVWESKLD